MLSEPQKKALRGWRSGLSPSRKARRTLVLEFTQASPSNFWGIGESTRFVLLEFSASLAEISYGSTGVTRSDRTLRLPNSSFKALQQQLSQLAEEAGATDLILPTARTLETLKQSLTQLGHGKLLSMQYGSENRAAKPIPPTSENASLKSQKPSKR